MNPVEFSVSNFEDDPQDIIDEVDKVLMVMGVTSVDKEKLVSYQLKGVA